MNIEADVLYRLNCFGFGAFLFWVLCFLFVLCGVFGGCAATLGMLQFWVLLGCDRSVFLGSGVCFSSIPLSG